LNKGYFFGFGAGFHETSFRLTGCFKNAIITGYLINKVILPEE
jgi:hypothetical protein